MCIFAFPYCIDSTYGCLHSFTEERSSFEYGQVNHALTAAMRTLMKEYLILVTQLEHLHRQGLLSLQKLWFYIQPTMRTMEILASIGELKACLWISVCFGVPACGYQWAFESLSVDIGVILSPFGARGIHWYSCNNQSLDINVWILFTFWKKFYNSFSNFLIKLCLSIGMIQAVTQFHNYLFRWDLSNLNELIEIILWVAWFGMKPSAWPLSDNVLLLHFLSLWVIISYVCGEGGLHGRRHAEPASRPHFQLHRRQPGPGAVPVPHQSRQRPLLRNPGEVGLQGHHQRPVQVRLVNGS